MKLPKILQQYSGLSRSAYILFFARMVTAMGSFIWPMLTLILSLKMGYSESQISIIFLLVSVLYLPGTIIGGKITDKFNKKKVIIVFDTITVLFFFLSALTEPGTKMLVFFVIAGLFATMEGPTFEAIVAEASLPKEREKFYSLTYLGNNVGFIIGASLAGFMVSNYLSLAFIINGITTLSSTILIVLFVKYVNKSKISEEDKNEYEEHIDTSEKGISILKKRKPILFIIVIAIFYSFVYDQWGFIIPLSMTKTLGTIDGPVYYGLVAGFNGLVVIIATPILTHFMRKMYELPKLMIGSILYFLSFMLLILFQYLPIYFVFMLFFTIGEVVSMLGSTPYVSRRVPASHRGRISSYMGIAYFLGSTIGRLVIGFTIDKINYETGYLLLSLFAFIAFILYLFNYQLDKKTFPNLYKHTEKKL